jgi:hypothetical protein
VFSLIRGLHYIDFAVLFVELHLFLSSLIILYLFLFVTFEFIYWLSIVIQPSHTHIMELCNDVLKLLIHVTITACFCSCSWTSHDGLDVWLLTDACFDYFSPTPTTRPLFIWITVMNCLNNSVSDLPRAYSTDVISFCTVLLDFLKKEKHARNRASYYVSCFDWFHSRQDATPVQNAELWCSSLLLARNGALFPERIQRSAH